MSVLSEEIKSLGLIISSSEAAKSVSLASGSSVYNCIIACCQILTVESFVVIL